MVTLPLAVMNAWVFHRTVYGKVADWDLDRVPPRSVRVAGCLSLALWVAIITLGRMIPYQMYWFDCARHRQSAIVNFLMSC